MEDDDSHSGYDSSYPQVVSNSLDSVDGVLWKTQPVAKHYTIEMACRSGEVHSRLRIIASRLDMIQQDRDRLPNPVLAVFKWSQLMSLGLTHIHLRMSIFQVKSHRQPTCRASL